MIWKVEKIVMENSEIETLEKNQEKKTFFKKKNKIDQE